MTSQINPWFPPSRAATRQYRPVSTDLMMVCSPGMICSVVVLPLAG
jgi:hypothetical protein